jgi:hypothetical protein
MPYDGPIAMDTAIAGSLVSIFRTLERIEGLLACRSLGIGSRQKRWQYAFYRAEE